MAPAEEALVLVLAIVVLGGQWAIVPAQQGLVRPEVLLLWLSLKTLFLSSSLLMGSPALTCGTSM